MRLIAAIVALCVCGCYSPHYGDCLVTCATSGDCPTDYSCDGTYCRNGTTNQDCLSVLGDAALAGDALRPDVPTGPDDDGDGTPNSVDNCPTAGNPDQNDEDSDGEGDVCDICPPYDNYFDFFEMAMKDADADSDGDGVGDGCDPDSDVSHPPNHIVLFEGFKTKPAGNAAFTETGSQWTFDGDAVASLTANNQRLTIGWPSPTSFFFVYTSVQWVSDPGPTTGAGTFLLSSPGQNDGWGCLLWDQGGATPRVLALVDLPTTVGSGDTVAFDYDTGGSYQARVGFNPATSTVSCSLQATAMSSPSSTGAPVNAAAGVTANGMKAKFHWVMIVN